MITTDLASNEYGWWQIHGGKVDFDYNGLTANENGWWRLAGGKIDFDYNGFASNENGNWRVIGGKIDFNRTGVDFDGASCGVWKAEKSIQIITELPRMSMVGGISVMEK